MCGPFSPWVAVQEDLLGDPAMAQRVHTAHQRGLKMIWRGEPGERPTSTMASCFARNMVVLTAEEALTGLRASLARHNGSAAMTATPPKSPVVPGHIYESVASRALVEHCLDEQGAWAVAGWPSEEVLHGYRHRIIQPDHRAVVKLIESTVADDSMESIEHTLSEEPVLVYRFMRYVNSAALGLPGGIDSLRHGLMVLGYSKLKSWLLEQLPHTTSDLSLHPIHGHGDACTADGALAGRGRRRRAATRCIPVWPAVTDRFVHGRASGSCFAEAATVSPN